MASHSGDSFRSPYSSKITGIGAAFPSKSLTNHELASILAKKGIETNDEWIRERTGIASRRISERGNPAEFNSSLGARAATEALKMAGRDPLEIEHILYATCSPDMVIPSTACFVQTKLGATKASATDMNAACSGFIYGLATADAYIKSGYAKTILVIGSEVTSGYVNWDDRTSCILFGDAAGAAIVERVPADSPSQILSTHLGADGNYWELFNMPAGGTNMEVTAEVREQRLDKMHMKGKEIYKVAVRTLAEYAERALAQHKLTINDIDWVVPHQANLRIIEAVAKRLQIPSDKLLLNLDRYGNTSAATVPTAIHEAVQNGKIKRGQLILSTVFGAGLTYGSALIRW